MELANNVNSTVAHQKPQRALDITDLNAFIATLKKREENLIQLLDYLLKYKDSDNPEEFRQITNLNQELLQLERNRDIIEDEILAKYIDAKIFDGKQKR